MTSCSRSNIESCKPAAWLSGLIYQLAAQFPEYRSEMERFQPPNWGDPPESLFRTLVADPLRASRARSAGAGEPWVFAIDGLDESVAAAGPALADLIAGSSPAGRTGSSAPGFAPTEFAAVPQEGERRLAEACWREYRAGVATPA